MDNTDHDNLAGQERARPIPPGSQAPPPTTAHGFTCAECDAPALECHATAHGWHPYCARCAPVWRPYAHVVLGADVAYHAGLRPGQAWMQSAEHHGGPRGQ